MAFADFDVGNGNRDGIRISYCHQSSMLDKICSRNHHMMEYMTITAICKQCALYNEIKLKLNYLMIPDMYMVALVIGPF